MDINKSLLKAIEDSMNNKGISIELSSNCPKDYFDINEQLDKENIRTYISCNYLDSNMFLYTFVKMLKNDEINISFKENASEKDMKYLENLSQYFQ